jgi:ribosomal protein S27E
MAVVVMGECRDCWNECIVLSVATTDMDIAP